MNLYAKSIKANGEIEVEIVESSKQTIVTIPQEKVKELFGNLGADFQNNFKLINDTLKNEHVAKRLTTI